MTAPILPSSLRVGDEFRYTLDGHWMLGTSLGKSATANGARVRRLDGHTVILLDRDAGRLAIRVIRRGEGSGKG